MKLKDPRIMESTEVKSMDTKSNDKTFAKKLFETFNTRSSKLAITATVAFALWQTPSMAGTSINKKITISGANNYRELVKWDPTHNRLINGHDLWTSIIPLEYEDAKYKKPATYKNVKDAKSNCLKKDR